MVEGEKDGKVEWWNDGNVEWWSDGNVEMWKNGMVEMWNERRMEWWNEGMREGWNIKKDISSFKHAIRCSFFASCKLIRGKKSCHSAKGIPLGLS
jgi:hypothetical protein